MSKQMKSDVDFNDFNDGVEKFFIVESNYHPFSSMSR